MSGAWQDLAGNLAIVVLSISLWMQGQHWLEGKSGTLRRWAFAIWMGMGCVASMMLAVQLEAGVFFDLRATMVVVSGLLGGPASALVTGAMAITYRFAVGGAGAVPGIVGLSFAIGVGSACHLLMNSPTPFRVALLAAGVGAGLAGNFGILFMPEALRSVVLLMFSAPLFFLNGTATILATMSIVRVGKLRNERVVLRRALTEAPDFLYVKDLESKFVAVNRGVARHHGFDDPRQMVGLSDYDLEQTDRARELFTAEQRIMRQGKVFADHEEILVDASGQQRWYVTSKLAIKDGESETIGLVGVTRDVTRYRQLEQDLMDSRNLLARALAEMSDGVAMFDREGRLVFCNQRYSDSFPLTAMYRRPGALLRQILEQVLATGEQLGAPQVDGRGWVESVIGSLKAGGEEQVQLFDGTWLHIRTRPGSDGSALVVVSDATVMKNAEAALIGLNEQLQTLATTDALTGLSNRRAFDASLLAEVSRAARSKESLALLLIDVDQFKRFNDLYGHVAGDDCLRRVAECLRRAVRRPGDLTSRYGGEEFALLLPNTDEDGAYFIAEAIRNALKGQAIKHAGSDKGIVTASLGIAVVQGEQLLPEDLIERADQALYGAKAAGRDRVLGWKKSSEIARKPNQSAA